MIKLNDNKYNKILPTKENLFKFISDYDIIKYYEPNLKINSVNHSPFRKDIHPSFTVFVSKKYNKILFKDLRTGEKGDVIKFVQKKYNLSLQETLEQIIIDFNLESKFYLYLDHIKKNPKKPIIYDVDFRKLKKETDLKIKARDWRIWDIQYWKSYGVCLNTLKKYKVQPLQYIFLNNRLIKPDKYSYAYVESKNGNVEYKIYQPKNLDMKWLNNFSPNTLSGYTQLPKIGNLIFISSSLKDGMCLHDLGYNFIAPQTENYSFKESLITELKNRFKYIVVFYDNDEAGISAAKELKEKFGLYFIHTNSKHKDISDFYYHTNKLEALKLIKLQLNNLNINF